MDHHSFSHPFRVGFIDPISLLADAVLQFYLFKNLLKLVPPLWDKP